MVYNCNDALNNLVLSSEKSRHHRLEWISRFDITDIKSSPMDTVHYAIRKENADTDKTPIVLVPLGNDRECTTAYVSEFARIYSLPTCNYNNNDNNFRRHKRWLECRNAWITGFTMHDTNYCMVADKLFYHYYSRYGFCAACGLLRCSPVWCICGHKQLSDDWTSDNRQLDEFIKKSQLQTNSPNHAYLEWIPYDCIDDKGDYTYLNDLPTDLFVPVKLIPLEITDETHDLYYAELCDKHPDILNTDVWVTIGFTHDTKKQKYYLIKHEDELCLACTERLRPEINAFCYKCKAPRIPHWTTGNKSLDLFIMKSWKNTKNYDDAHIQWIEYSQLSNVQEATSLRHGCTHMADWLKPGTNELTRVTLNKINDKQNDQSDFHQLTQAYPTILTPDNLWIVGITQELSTRKYCLVFYYDVHEILDTFMQIQKLACYIPYNHFDELKEIGSSGYGTVYIAKYDVLDTVVLKRFKSFDERSELFISEFRNHVKCVNNDSCVYVYGVTQEPETKEYMMVMRYANNGSLLSYLVQNINRLTWKMKLERLRDVAGDLSIIHDMRLVHCNLHGRNIVVHGEHTLICGFSQSTSLYSCQQNPTIQGNLSFIAPEVFHTRRFTQKSDIYSFGIIMHLMATGEPPFGDKQLDERLIRDIIGGLRPTMPDSAPKEYKNLAEQCCDADPNNRRDAGKLWFDIDQLCYELDDDDDTWNAIYHNEVKP